MCLQLPKQRIKSTVKFGWIVRVNFRLLVLLFLGWINTNVRACFTCARWLSWPAWPERREVRLGARSTWQRLAPWYPSTEHQHARACGAIP